MALLGILTGCVSTELLVTNRAGTGVHIYSAHTKIVTTIPPGVTAAVPHTSGEMVVINQRDEIWEYGNIQTLVAEATRRRHHVSLHVTISTNGSLVLPSGHHIDPVRKKTSPH